jgi:Fe-S oxidoreductase
MTTKTVFNPGCALSIYKPNMEHKILDFLNQHYQETTMHNICCRHDPQLPEGSLIINVCAGCDKRFSTLYKGVTTISIYEILDKLDTFPYPNHNGLTMSLHDPCPIRQKPQVHQSVRNLLKKMNIEIIETKYNSSRSICCGDNFYPTLPIDKIHAFMKKRADSMPHQQVCVYCVSCIKSLHIGGKTPRYLIDLLFNQPTAPQTTDTVDWHNQLQQYIDNH